MATNRTSGNIDYLFQKLARGLPDAISLTQADTRTEAREWFRRVAAEITQVDANRFMTGAKRDRRLNRLNMDNIGQMFMFFYDAKHKKTLPYWDRLPLIFPIEIYKDGFLGINLHYLPPIYRARFMDALYTVANNQKYDNTTRLRIRYRILKNAEKFAYFRPCIKRYLSDHVASNFIKIEPTEWDMALMLPTERFQKKRKENVWQESVQQIRRRTTS